MQNSTGSSRTGKSSVSESGSFQIQTANLKDLPTANSSLLIDKTILHLDKELAGSWKKKKYKQSDIIYDCSSTRSPACTFPVSCLWNKADESAEGELLKGTSASATALGDAQPVSLSPQHPATLGTTALLEEGCVFAMYSKGTVLLRGRNCQTPAALLSSSCWLGSGNQPRSRSALPSRSLKPASVSLVNN